MKRFQCFQYAAAAIASFGLVLPSAALAADADRAPAPASAAQTPSILDVRLGEEGTLTGQVLNGQGRRWRRPWSPCGAPVSTWPPPSPTLRGTFSVRGLQGGVYEIKSAGGSGFFRLWTANSSPPSAHQGVLIVAGEQVSRGQGLRPQQLLGPATGTRAILGAVVGGGLVGGVAAWAVTEHKSSS